MEILAKKALESNEPKVDVEDHRAVVVRSFLDKLTVNFSYISPGNDLFSHKIEIESKMRRIDFFLRYLDSIYTIVCYNKPTCLSYFYAKDIVLSTKEEKFSSFLKKMDFYFIPCEALMSYHLEESPITNGLNSNTLFSIYFEDQ
jgi:hypothetical protein